MSQPLTEWSTDNPSANVRVNSMVAKCSDAEAILIAEQIHEQRMAGLPTHTLELRLDIEMNRMFTATRILHGRSTSSASNFFKTLKATEYSTKK